MKNRFAILCVLPLFMALCAACTGEPSAALASDAPASVVTPEATPASVATPEALPADPTACTIAGRTVFYPEGSDAATADYILEYDYPQFAASASRQNEAIAQWESELLSRVSAERLPFADRAAGAEAPYTRVRCTVTQAAGYTNLLFNEEVCYGGNPMEERYALVLDETGAQTDLYTVTGLYTPSALLAQQVYNAIAAAPANGLYFGDLALADIESAMDLYDGFTVQQTGYTLYFPAGTVADEAAGPMEFFVNRQALYPDFVGIDLGAAEYEALRAPLGDLAVVCGGENRGFDGAPDALVYTLFMARQFRDRPAESGVIRVPQAEYEALGRTFFTVLPAELAGGDGTTLTDGIYAIPFTTFAEYGLRLDDCRATAQGPEISGVLLYGAPGGADWGELAPVTIKLQKQDDAWKIAGFLFA